MRRVATDCEAVRQVVLASTRLESEKVSVVPPAAVPAAFAESRIDPATARDRLAVPADARVVGLFGMRAWQGWKELLQAGVIVRRDIPAVHLVFAGCHSRRQAAAVLQVAAETGLGGAVTAVRDDDPARLLAACDLVVDASWAGTSVGAALAPAMAMGRPVVATALAGNAELVTDGESGSWCRPATWRRWPRPSRGCSAMPTSLTASPPPRGKRATGAFSLAGRVEILEAVYRGATNPGTPLTPSDT